MDKEDIVCIYNRILLSHTKERNWVICSHTWLNLESVIQSEVSQKQKNKYQVLTNIYGIYKNGTDKPICRERKDMQAQRMDLWTKKGKEKSGQTEIGTDINTLPCIKQIAGKIATCVQHRELNLLPCGDVDGWQGGHRVRKIQEGRNTCTLTANSCCTAETNTT